MRQSGNGKTAYAVPMSMLDFDVMVNARGEVAIIYRLGVDSLFSRAVNVRLAGRVELEMDDGAHVRVGRMPWAAEQAARRAGAVLMLGVDDEGRPLAAAHVSVVSRASEESGQVSGPGRPSGSGPGATGLRAVARAWRQFETVAMA